MQHALLALGAINAGSSVTLVHSVQKQPKAPAPSAVSNDFSGLILVMPLLLSVVQ
jgi:hypothetical protein